MNNPDAGPTVSLWRRLDRTGVPMLLCRLVLGVLFIKMGLSKIGDPVHFLKTIRLYEMVPENPPLLLNLMAVVIPWLEVICGSLLILGVALSGSALLLVGMLIVFTSAIFIRTMKIYLAGDVAFTQIEFDCGCGGGPTVIYLKLLENLGLLTLGVIALLSRSRRFCLPLAFSRRSEPAVMAAAMEPGTP